MTSSVITRFHEYIEASKRDMDGFVKFFAGLRYNYYYATPPTPVPDEVWHYIADDYEVLPYEMLGEVLDVSPDKTSGLIWDSVLLEDDWDERVVAANKFKLLCRQCVAGLQDHTELLAIVPELQTVAQMPSGHHQWICLIHSLAEGSPLWSDLVAKRLVISQHPHEETLIDRDDRELMEPMVQKLNEQGKAVPNIWVEHIRAPHSVVSFHSQMLDVLDGIVKDSYEVDVIGGLSPTQIELILNLGEEKLNGDELCAKVDKTKETIQGASGHRKTALSELGKRGIMKNDRIEGYELTPLGLGILEKLRKKKKDRGPD